MSGIRYIVLRDLNQTVYFYATSLVDLGEESATWGMKTTPPYGSSEEY